MNSSAEKGSPPALNDNKLSRNGTDSTLAIPRSGTTGTGATAVGSQGLGFAPHTVPATKVLEALGVTDPVRGLSDEEAARRLEQYGPNRLKPPPKPSLLKICGRQVANAMTLVLSEYKRRSPPPRKHMT
jgi:magnesium-transporting ATPase (P-type)